MFDMDVFATPRISIVQSLARGAFIIGMQPAAAIHNIDFVAQHIGGSDAILPFGGGVKKDNPQLSTNTRVLLPYGY